MVKKEPQALDIMFKHALELSEEDFGAMIIDGKLALPWDLEPLCHNRAIETSALLVALIRTAPRDVALAIDWDTSKVLTAYRGLRKILLPYHGDDSVSTIPPPARPAHRR